jgi:hypothetical protein
VATDPPGDLLLAPIQGEPRTLAGWLLTFHLAIVVLDPFTRESSWLLESAGRILLNFREADCRVAFLLTSSADEARQFLGPWADRLLVLADPEREAVKALDLNELPAFVHIRMDGTVAGVAEGWDPDEWRAVADGLAAAMRWIRPSIPGPDDPLPFAGSSARG